MLALLKPWHQLTSLAQANYTFEEEFTTFTSNANESVKRVIANVAYYPECTDSAKRARELILAAPIAVDINNFIRRDTELAKIEDLQVDHTQDNVQLARNNRYTYSEWLYAEGAMSVAMDAGIFAEEPAESSGLLRGRTTIAEMTLFTEWDQKIKQMVRAQLLRPSNAIDVPTENENTHVRIPLPFVAAALPEEETSFVCNTKQQKAIDILNTEQRHTHDLIEAHTIRTLSGVRQKQLLMIVQGEGGTGKTVLLNAITHMFAYLRASDALAKTATTGVAASLVSGQTVHSWAGITPMEKEKEGEDGVASASTHTSAEKRKHNILPAKYLNIDECSMMTKKLLARLSQVVGGVQRCWGWRSVATFWGTERDAFR
ncbi:hypothetical protein DFH07DRAFT_970207 [Mycena maculata]|uniref:ATP-dependent DNA helicase n=1 Tax=Mycena maculata TaxID=230809 RepID=A0AAD7MQB3_9AGAR|nr:hypothetical protein DFH07DRAFT_970207 [Mycena maculata]